MMFRMIMRRLGIGVVTLWVVSLLMFAGTEILPGDVAEIMLGQEATPESLAALREKLGLNKSAPVRYLEWLGGHGDLRSRPLARRPLRHRRRWRHHRGAHRRPPPEHAAALFDRGRDFGPPLGHPSELLAAMFPTSLYDRTVTFTTLCLVAVPEFFIATMLVLILGGAAPVAALHRHHDRLRVGVAPAALAVPAHPHSVLRAACADVPHDRAAVLNVMSSPYIEMAILKGVPRRRIILRHALFNAIGPIVNIIALNLAYLVSGVVIVEVIFAFPGLAKLMVDGVQVRDMPLVQACGMIFCSTYVVLILVSDIASIVSNPRLRHPK